MPAQRWGPERLETRCLLAADVLITEFMASNDDVLRDEDGDSPDWIELYNAGPDDVNLHGWHLTDNEQRLTKWSFPATVIPAGEFLLVYASGKDRSVPGRPLHTGFKLDADGEFLALSRDTLGSTEIVAQFAPQYPEQLTDISYGLPQSIQGATIQHGEPIYFTDPTPGEPNPASSTADFLINDVQFDQPAGFYEQPLEVTISSQTAGTTIRYTLDGTQPSESNGSEYIEPLTIAATTTLRARSWKPGREPSHVETATYLFLADVLQQSPTGRSPAGFPQARSINGQQLDYGMDPDIVDNRRWGRQLEAALKQVPTLSLVMDVEDLLGSRRGIYTHARNHGRSWERPASLELINADGTPGFQVETGVRIRGGFSRTGSNPKHAFRFFFREEYGDRRLEYPLFGSEGTDRFRKVDLRTTQNYSWAFRNDARNNFIRDIFSRDIQGAMGQPYTRGRYYHLYINGQYWGLYQTEERPEANYAASYFGGDASDYDVVKSTGSNGDYQNEATDGSLTAYRRLANFFYQRNGLGDENMEDYFRVQGMNPDGTRNPEFERLLDVDNLIDYMVITYYTSDADGPGSKFTRPKVNNYFAIYNRNQPDGFKFLEHDSEHSLDTGNAAGANYNMVTRLTTGGRQFRYFNPHWMHEQLAENNSVYRLRFADAVYRHLHHGGVLTVEKALQFVDRRAAEFDVAMIAESARWGDAKRRDPFTQTHWKDAVEVTRDWIRERRDVVLTQLRQQGWYPESNPPEFVVDGALQHGGALDGALKLQSTAALSYTTVVPSGSEWKYLDDGSNQRIAWRRSSFDDSSWPSGTAQLGYGDGDEVTVLDFGDNSSNKSRTYYFRQSFEANDLANVDGAMIRLLRDDGALVYLNGQEIARSNMPAGSVNYRTEASSVVGSRHESTFFPFSFDASLLREGTNQLAVEVHQVSGTSSDVSFDLELLLGRFNPAKPSIYYTLDGSDPRLPDGAISPAAIPYSGEEIIISRPTRVTVRSLKDGTWSVRNAAHFDPNDGPLGDLNGDGLVDAVDIDLLTAAIREVNNDPRFDLNEDDLVDLADRATLVEDILGTQLGDVDLDGRVRFADFLILSAHYGGVAESWSQGDVDGDGEVGFTDFLFLSAQMGVDEAMA